MKTIATIIFAFISVFVTAQTKLDTLVFNKVNEYRVSKGVPELKWDTNSFKAANLHTKYLFRKNFALWPVTFSGHSEDTLKSPSDRFESISKERWTKVGEAALAISKNYKVGDTLMYNKMATEIVTAWKLSEKHNEIILSREYVFGGVSCDSLVKGTGLKGVDSYRIVSTFFLIKK